MHRGTLGKSAADFSEETMKARIKWYNILYCQTRILNPVKLSFKKEDKNKYLPRETKRICCHQKNFFTRYAKASTSGWKETPPDGNLNPHKKIKAPVKVIM